MALIRWEPVAELNTIQNEMNRLFNTFFDQPAQTGRGSGTDSDGGCPAMDLVETADHYVLRADLPGLSDEDVSIQLEDNVLTISGERKTEHRDAAGGLLPARARVRQLRPLADPARRRRPRRRPSPLRPRRARDPHPQARAEEAQDRPDQPRQPTADTKTIESAEPQADGRDPVGRCLTATKTVTAESSSGRCAADRAAPPQRSAYTAREEGGSLGDDPRSVPLLPSIECPPAPRSDS